VPRVQIAAAADAAKNQNRGEQFRRADLEEHDRLARFFHDGKRQPRDQLVVATSDQLLDLLTGGVGDDPQFGHVGGGRGR
jgi:hypothetical protein